MFTETNAPLWYPPSAFTNCSEEQRASVIEEDSAFLDLQAAKLLDIVADAPRGCWADPAHAVRCRRVIRQVSDWLRQRA